MSNLFDYFTHSSGDSDVHGLMDIQNMDDIDVPLNFENNDLMVSFNCSLKFTTY